jgi:thiol-disulfide isomerase/thioredoxin
MIRVEHPSKLSREDVAKLQIGRTDIPRWLSRVLVVFLLLTIYAVPAIQHARDIQAHLAGQRPAPWPQCYDIFRGLPGAADVFGRTEGGFLDRLFAANRSILRDIHAYEDALSQEATVTFEEPGYYLITLRVTDRAGIKEPQSAQARVIVTGTPQSMSWLPSVDTALTQARAQGKVVMVDFYSDSCAWCTQMFQQSFTNYRVASLANQSFLSVRVNWDTQQRVAQKYGVITHHTIVWLKGDGEEVNRAVGFLPPDDLISQMRKALQQAG